MKSLRLLAVVFCLAVIAPWLRADHSASPPNILFIFADDVGQEVLECYGGQSYPTPHLNELARSGMKFNHAYSMPVCHPSRLTLMSGKYPFRHGKVAWGDFPKEAEDQTFSR
ncbi:MAG: sulfatase-like hydrolase/transferase, partial [Verrucomicrobia bacterium]|nr:sulfatase-like hydrolase/transferase [Verrucomicrobiota bacterium]